jgi:hypothetical protein
MVYRPSSTRRRRLNSIPRQCRRSYFNQQKVYQKVVAPFDGVITQRNIDVGSLITANAAGGTAMFSVTHSDVSDRPTTKRYAGPKR